MAYNKPEKKEVIDPLIIKQSCRHYFTEADALDGFNDKRCVKCNYMKYDPPPTKQGEKLRYGWTNKSKHS